MNSQSIEFDKMMQDSTTPDIVRKSFRVPIEDSKNAWVVIQKQRFFVKDICLGGISIAVEDNSVFSIDQILKNCELTINEVSINNLTGRIIHFSSSTGKELQCGIQWQDMEEKTAGRISEIVLKMKEQLLKDDSMYEE